MSLCHGQKSKLMNILRKKSIENSIFIIRNGYYLISFPVSLVKLIICSRVLIKRLLPILFAS